MSCLQKQKIICPVGQDTNCKFAPAGENSGVDGIDGSFCDGTTTISNAYLDSDEIIYGCTINIQNTIVTVIQF